jgi:hypothetical protein
MTQIIDVNKLSDDDVMNIDLRSKQIRAKVREDAERDAKNDAWRQQQALENQRMAIEQAVAAQRQLERDRQLLSRPPTFAAYSALSASEKVSLNQAFPNIVNDVRSFEKSGLVSWALYDARADEFEKRRQARQGLTSAESQGQNYSDQRKAAAEKHRLQYRSRAEEFFDDEREQARIAVEKGFGRSK